MKNTPPPPFKPATTQPQPTQHSQKSTSELRQRKQLSASSFASEIHHSQTDVQSYNLSSISHSIPADTHLSQVVEGLPAQCFSAYTITFMTGALNPFTPLVNSILFSPLLFTEHLPSLETCITSLLSSSQESEVLLEKKLLNHSQSMQLLEKQLLKRQKSQPTIEKKQPLDQQQSQQATADKSSLFTDCLASLGNCISSLLSSPRESEALLEKRLLNHSQSMQLLESQLNLNKASISSKSPHETLKNCFSKSTIV